MKQKTAFLLVSLLGVSLLGTGVAISGTDEHLDRLVALVGDGEYAEAETAAREILSGIETEHGADSVQAAAVLDLLVQARWRSGKSAEPETRELAERAVRIKTAALGADHPEIAESLHNLAVVHFFRGEYLDAKPLWERAVAIRRAALGPDDPEVAKTVNALANLLNVIGEFDQARQLYEEALAIRERAYGKEHARVGESLNNLGNLLALTGEFAEALRVLERAVEVKREALGAEHPQFPSSLGSLGGLLRRMGDYERAQPVLEEAVTLYEKSLGPEHPRVGQALNNLGEMLRAAGETEKARRTYERAAAVLEKAYGPDHPELAVILDNLADLFEAEGNTEKAEALYRRVLTVREDAVGGQHPDVAESLLSLGMLLARSDRVAEARPLLERALEIRETALGSVHPQVADALIGLAEVLAASGEVPAALQLALRAETIGRDHLRLTGRSLAEQLALRYAAVRSRGLDMALSLAAGNPTLDGRAQILDSLVRSRAVILDEMAARQRSIAATADPELARLAAELAAARTTLANRTVRGVGSMSPDTYRGLLDEARRNKEAAESALAAASDDFARERERSLLGLEETAAGLPPSGALIAYVVYDRELSPTEEVRSYLAMVLRSGKREPVVVPLGTADEIEPLIQRWKREVASPHLGATPEETETRYRRVSEALRARIWDPLVTHLAGTNQVFIVPDGGINLVSFASLPTADGKYLIEGGILLHYLSAERDIVSASTRASAGSGLLALGGPDYETRPQASAPAGSAAGTTRSTCGSFDTLRFEPLPAAEVEAAEVAALWSEVVGADKVLHLAGPAASEEAFKRHAPNRRVLHLATHGFFLGGEDCAPVRSRTRSRGLKLTRQEPVVTGLSPLLLSGLALAGANNRAAAAAGEEDGVITAEEIASLNLSGVELAVLSACDTGVGEIQAGEGVSGLRRAMQVAGVRTLVMSLWPVDDDATRAWMKAMYGARLHGQQDVPQAVRSAARAVLDARRETEGSAHPFYWAAFVAAGEWR